MEAIYLILTPYITSLIMKKTAPLITSLLLLFCSFAMAQTTETLPVNAETKKIQYSEVEKTNDNTNKDVIYDRAFSWAQNNKFRITQMDKANGVMTCEGSFLVTYPGPRVGMNDNGVIKFTVTVNAKDGRYKYDIINFKHEGGKGKGNGGPLENKSAECGKFVLPDGGWAKIKKDTAIKMKALISDLKASISQQGEAPVKSDW
jgi:Domain of unknown function (DUF4468) with TBP-like fold